jgi:hypothetical protein
MKPFIGYVYSKDSKVMDAVSITVYMTIQNLRLFCGEIPANEIVEVTVEEKK